MSSSRHAHCWIYALTLPLLISGCLSHLENYWCIFWIQIRLQLVSYSWYHSSKRYLVSWRYPHLIIQKKFTRENSLHQDPKTLQSWRFLPISCLSLIPDVRWFYEGSNYKTYFSQAISTSSDTSFSLSKSLIIKFDSMNSQKKRGFAEKVVFKNVLSNILNCATF